MSNQSNTTSTDDAEIPQLVELGEIEAKPKAGPNVFSGNLALLESLSVTLDVVVGKTNTTLGELMALREASILKIDREADAPVDVVVNGIVVARGHLVVVDDNFGVQITEIAASEQ